MTRNHYIDRNLKDQNPIWVRMWATTYDALARGELARVDKTLEKLLGRPLTTFEQTLTQILTNKEADAKATQLTSKYV
jgi:hypothetical protein